MQPIEDNKEGGVWEWVSVEEEERAEDVSKICVPFMGEEWGHGGD